MHQPLHMDGVYSSPQLAGIKSDSREGQPFSKSITPRQRTVRRIFHSEVEQPIHFARIENLHNMRMIELRERACFSKKSPLCTKLFANAVYRFREEYLDGDLLFEVDMLA